MKATLHVDIAAFATPAHAVLRLDPPAPPHAPASAGQPMPAQWGPADCVNIPLQMIDPVSLDALCDDFKLAVFERAGKLIPELPQACRPSIDSAMKILRDLRTHVRVDTPLWAMLDDLELEIRTFA